MAFEIKPSCQKTTMSVPEMGKMLGLGKTESYYLVKKNFFKTILVNKHIRIYINSFEEWYANQWHYRKVDGSPPGVSLSQYISIDEIAETLDLNQSAVNWIVYSSGRFETMKINGAMCIKRNDFEKWYSHQFRYNKVNGELPGSAMKASYSSSEVAEMLGIPLRNTAYALVSRKLFESEIVEGQLRIDKHSFERWYQNQSHYKKISKSGKEGEYNGINRQKKE